MIDVENQLLKLRLLGVAEIGEREGEPAFKLARQVENLCIIMHTLACCLIHVCCYCILMPCVRRLAFWSCAQVARRPCRGYGPLLDLPGSPCRGYGPLLDSLVYVFVLIISLLSCFSCFLYVVVHSVGESTLVLRILMTTLYSELWTLDCCDV